MLIIIPRGISKLKCCISELNIMGMIFIIMFYSLFPLKHVRRKIGLV
jgi:hypothetical protein